MPSSCCFWLSSLQEATTKWEAIIEKDVPRTFPKHKLFAKADSVGCVELRRVLKATALHVPEVGYVQGMNFIAGYFLAETRDELVSFLLLVRMLRGKEYGMHDIFSEEEGLSKLWIAVYQVQHCLRLNDPALALHFEKIKVNYLAWLPQWILTIFTKHVQPPHMNALVEAFLKDGWPSLIRTCVAVLMTHRDKILTLSFDEMLPYLNGIAGIRDKDQKDIWHAIDLAAVGKMLDQVELPDLDKLEGEMSGKSREERNVMIQELAIQDSKGLKEKVTQTKDNKSKAYSVFAGLAAAALIGGVVASTILKARR